MLAESVRARIGGRDPCQPQKFEINNFFRLFSSVLLGLAGGEIWSSEGEMIKQLFNNHEKVAK